MTFNRRTLAWRLGLAGLVGSTLAVASTPVFALGGHKGGRVVVSGPTLTTATPPSLVPSSEVYYAPGQNPSTNAYVAQPPAPTYVQPTGYTSYGQPPGTVSHAPRPVVSYQPTAYTTRAPMSYAAPMVTQSARPSRMLAPRRWFRSGN